MYGYVWLFILGTALKSMLGPSLIFRILATMPRATVALGCDPSMSYGAARSQSRVALWSHDASGDINRPQFVFGARYAHLGRSSWLG